MRLKPIRTKRHRGAAAFDYALVLGIVMPMIGFTVWLAPQVMGQVYKMTCALLSWPFM
ncbi:MAG: hypothetical protein K8T25_18815 [Planctomycetia bacterium]|nr:hypothetical protein [Planctomycetia bacterium]